MACKDKSAVAAGLSTFLAFFLSPGNAVGGPVDGSVCMRG